jgi:hypothetical protein
MKKEKKEQGRIRMVPTDYSAECAIQLKQWLSQGHGGEKR